jgi:hypothetical protein
MGVTAMAIAMVFDSAYAVLTGKAGALLSRRRLVPVSRVSSNADAITPSIVRLRFFIASRIA